MPTMRSRNIFTRQEETERKRKLVLKRQKLRKFCPVNNFLSSIDILVCGMCFKEDDKATVASNFVDWVACETCGM